MSERRRRNHSSNFDFFPGVAGNLFVATYRPKESNGKIVVVVPPLAEELNRSRHILSRQARLLADQGFEVIVYDLYGTGDSDGEFGDASWSIWLDDTVEVFDEAVTRAKSEVWVIAVRGGAILATEALKRCQSKVTGIVLWSPIIRGKTLTNQLFRLKAMSGMLGSGESKTSSTELRANLHANGKIEIAGYEYSVDLIGEFESKSISIPASDISKVYWIELVGQEGASPPYGVTKFLDQNITTREARLELVVGPQFWATQELVSVPGLIFRTEELVGARM